MRKALALLSLAILAQLGAPFGLGVPAALSAQRSVPPPPKLYVLDEPDALPAKAEESLQSLLIEHDHLTGEQVLIAIFDSLEGEDVVDYTNRVFGEWKIGKRGKDNGVLLALYWKERKARIEVGYGLESLLTDAKSKLILSDHLIPELKRGNPARALALAATEILRTIESPLVQGGKTDQLLRSRRFRADAAPSEAPRSWFVWIALAAVLLTIAFNMISSADAHFTRAGWFRPRPALRRRDWRIGHGGGSPWGDWASPREHGGGFGGFGGGGFGGFRGGGGSSGGGGATGDW